MKFSVFAVLPALVSAECTDDKDISCPTASCGFCNLSLLGCLSSECSGDDFDSALTDCSGGHCNYHCTCRAPEPTPTPSPTPTPTPTPPPTPPSPGPLKIAHKDVKVGGYVCGSSQKARVYYPDDGNRYPLISFAHGFLCGGDCAYSGYKQLVEGHAKAGYVVIVLEAADGLVECAEEWKDQMHSFEYMETSDLNKHVDASMKKGLLGHSMGGGATYHSSSQTDLLAKYNIGVAAALNPQIRSPVPLMKIKDPEVPIMFTTGTADDLVPHTAVGKVYDETTGTKVLADQKGKNHFEPTSTGRNSLNDYIIAMMDCHIKGQSDRCDKVYKDLCERSDMSRCEVAGAPTLEELV